MIPRHELSMPDVLVGLSDPSYKNAEGMGGHVSAPGGPLLESLWGSWKCLEKSGKAPGGLPGIK